MQTVTYIPPDLGATKFKITAEFHDVVGGVSYQRPTPFSIRELEIIECDPAYEQYTKTMIDTSIFFDVPTAPHIAALQGKYPTITLPSKQMRGYLKYPIANPTAAEMLFTYYCLHKGQTHTLDCGCVGYQHKDDKGGIIYKTHPHHTKKCEFHANDTVDMKQAIADHGTLKK